MAAYTPRFPELQNFGAPVMTRTLRAPSDNQLETAATTATTADTRKADDITYDLDDPYLINKLCYAAPNLNLAGPITCRFFAIPLIATPSAPRNLEQYGQIVLETRDKLLMRIPVRNLPFLGCIRQIWVSKHLELGTECKITFDAPRGADADRTGTLILQSVDVRVEKLMKEVDDEMIAAAAALVLRGQSQGQGQDLAVPAQSRAASVAEDGVQYSGTQRVYLISFFLFFFGKCDE